jgi:hypothetical protein
LLVFLKPVFVIGVPRCKAVGLGSGCRWANIGAEKGGLGKWDGFVWYWIVLNCFEIEFCKQRKYHPAY